MWLHWRDTTKSQAELSIGRVWEEEVQAATGYMRAHRMAHRTAHMRVE